MSPPPPLPSIPTEEDIISDLPDSLLCHILSFLPTKLAVHTSLLSKRWRSLWLSVLTINADDQTFPDFQSFSIFVYSVIVSRHVKLPIKSLTLRCGHSFDFSSSHVNLFFSTAAQRGVENLNLDFYGPNIHSKFQLPYSVVNCKTLVVLKLSNVVIDYLPNVDYPLLKTLHLYKVSFTRYEDFVNFLVPNVEDLRANFLELSNWSEHGWNQFWQGKDESSFPKLIRADISYVDIPFHLLHRVEFLCAELVLGSYYLCNPKFHNLTHMELVFNSETWHGKWKWMIQLLQHCPKLRNLAVNEISEYGGGFLEDDWEDPQILPECLSSQLRKCALRCYEGRECELHFAKYIMENSKVLHTMTIHSTCSIDNNVKYRMLMKLSMCLRASPTCKLLFD